MRAMSSELSMFLLDFSKRCHSHRVFRHSCDCGSKFFSGLTIGCADFRLLTVVRRLVVPHCDLYF